MADGDGDGGLGTDDDLFQEERLHHRRNRLPHHHHRRDYPPGFGDGKGDGKQRGSRSGNAQSGEEIKEMGGAYREDEEGGEEPDDDGWRDQRRDAKEDGAAAAAAIGDDEDGEDGDGGHEGGAKGISEQDAMDIAEAVAAAANDRDRDKEGQPSDSGRKGSDEGDATKEGRVHGGGAGIAVDQRRKKNDGSTAAARAGRAEPSGRLIPADGRKGPAATKTDDAGAAGAAAAADTIDAEEDHRGGAHRQPKPKDPLKGGGTQRTKPTFQTRLSGAPACTDVEPDDISYTLVTQLSNDRLWMMGQHCRRWGLEAPISVVVYTDRTVANVTDAMIAGGCRKDQLTVQTLPTTDYAETEYPVNRMRNLALSAVQTTHVVYVDVDFWESTQLRKVLMMDSVRQELAGDHKLTAVVPAFQIMRQCKEYRDCREENLAKMPNTTEQMYDLVKATQAGAFDPTNRGGHGSTSYGAWYVQKEGEMYDIPCFKSNRYEPYLVFRYCKDLSPFQEQFTGFGKNKLTWVMQMRRMGWDFAQLGQVFLVHYPHLDSKSRLEWNNGPEKIQDPVKMKDGSVRRREPKELEDVDWSKYQRGQVDQLYVDFRKWLETELPNDSRVQSCKDATYYR